MKFRNVHWRFLTLYQKAKLKNAPSAKKECKEQKHYFLIHSKIQKKIIRLKTQFKSKFITFMQ